MGASSVNVTVLACDAEAGEAQRVFNVSDIKLTGGGGTDMGIGLAACEKLKPRPDVVIVLTDMYTPRPEEAPPFTTVVVALDDGGEWAHPPWGKVIQVPLE